MPLQGGFGILEPNSPLQLGGVDNWLDSSDYNTLSFNGSDISRIEDKSGKGNHAVQSSSANQPLYGGTLNGKSVISYSTNNWMDVPDFVDLSGATLFAVSKTNDPNTAQALGYAATGDSGGRRMLAHYSSTGTPGIFRAYVADKVILGSSANTNWNISTFLINGTGGEYWINRVSQGTYSNPAYTSGIAPGLSIGAALEGSYAFLNGMHAELVAFGRALSLSEIQFMWTYFENRWGL